MMTILKIWREGEDQGCQMVYLQNKNPNLGKFWRVLQWKMWGGFISFFTLQLQLLIAMLRLPMLVVVFFLA
jgi:hypothetical protein